MSLHDEEHSRYTITKTIVGKYGFRIPLGKSEMRDSIICTRVELVPVNPLPGVYFFSVVAAAVVVAANVRPP